MKGQRRGAGVALAGPWAGAVGSACPWVLPTPGVGQGSASRAGMAKEHSQALLVSLPSCCTDAATGCWVLWEEWVLHMDPLTQDSSRVEFCTGIAGSEPCGAGGVSPGFWQDSWHGQ